MSEDIYDIYNKFYGNNNDVKTIDKCSSCNDDKIILDKINSYKICTNCGVVDKVLFNDLDQESFETTATNKIDFFSKKSSFRTNIGGNKNNLLVKLHGWTNNCYKEDKLHKDYKECHEKCKKGNIRPYYQDIARTGQKIMSESKHLTGKNKGKHIIYRGVPSKQIKSAFLCNAMKHSDDDIRTPKEIAK
jgi:hypothetical protein